LTLQLSKYPALNNFEKQTNVPKVYVFLGLVGLYFFLVFFNIGGEFLVNFAGFIIPGYYSLEALFSTSKVDDTQWLTVRLLAPPEKQMSGLDTDKRLVLGCLRLPECL
jgi:receptor expression-enhancing protein 5/6